MKCPYDTAALEDFDAGRPSAEESAEMADHVAQCPRCGEELLWLLREQRLMAARAARSADAQRTEALWSGVAGRVAEQKRTQPRPAPRSTVLMGGLAAAAVMLLTLFATQGGGHPVAEPAVTALPPAPPADEDRDIQAALDEAERDYAAAAAALERRYQKRRASLAPEAASRADAILARGRPALQNATAGDVEMRQVMLATHADYVHALHTLVGGMEEVR